MKVSTVKTMGYLLLAFLLGMLGGHYITGKAFLIVIGTGGWILLIGGVIIDTFFHNK